MDLAHLRRGTGGLGDSRQLGNLPTDLVVRLMICSQCGQAVPGGALVCPCFEGRADEEAFALAIRRLLDGQGYLYLTPAPWKHLLASGKRGLTFCGEKRYTQASTRVVTLDEVRRMEQKDCCIECHARVTMRLGTVRAIR